MIDIKNKSRETRVYQYDKTISAGPVRPCTMTVHRNSHNPRTGVISCKEQSIVCGGVLTLAPKQTLRSLPDSLLEHPRLKRDIKANLVKITRHKDTTTHASVALVE